MKYVKYLLGIVCILLCTICLFFPFFVLTVDSPYNVSWGARIDKDLAALFGSFFGGVLGPVASLFSGLLLVYTIIDQNQRNRRQDIRDKFFKMIDYHNEILSQISVIEYKQDRVDRKIFRSEFKQVELRGRQAFVSYKIQIQALYRFVAAMVAEDKKGEDNIKELNEVIMGVVYIIFYYGFDKRWEKALKEELTSYLAGKTRFGKGSIRKDILHIEVKDLEGKVVKDAECIIEKLREKANDKSAETKNMLRVNQTYLSTYFKNMYNAIKLVDADALLEYDEKRKLVAMLRAQLSYPEVYVLFYNLFSKFWETWLENNYIVDYEFIKHISKVDLDLDTIKDVKGINPRDYFPEIDYENDFLAS